MRRFYKLDTITDIDDFEILASIDALSLHHHRDVRRRRRDVIRLGFSGRFPHSPDVILYLKN